MNKKITLREFTDDLKQQIEDFSIYWEENQKRDKDLFPKEFSLIEWQEQFLAYYSNE